MPSTSTVSATFFAALLRVVFAAGFAGAASGASSGSAVFAAAFFAGAFLAAAFFAVLAFTVVRLLVAAATFLRPAASSRDRTTVTPSSLRNLSSAFRCWGEIAAASLVSRTASALTCPVALPRSTKATTSGWARTSAGSLRDVLVDTNYLS